MVNTEQFSINDYFFPNYNILNIVVNTEHGNVDIGAVQYYNILNIVVNTELIR